MIFLGKAVFDGSFGSVNSDSIMYMNDSSGCGENALAFM